MHESCLRGDKGLSLWYIAQQVCVQQKSSRHPTLTASHGWYSALIDQDPASAEREFKDGYSEQEITNSTLFTATVPMGTHRLYIYNEPKYNAVKGLDGE